MSDVRITVQRNEFSRFDVKFAEFLLNEPKKRDQSWLHEELLTLRGLFMLASQALSEGHSCLSLERISGATIELGVDGAVLFERRNCESLLRRSGVVECSGEEEAVGEAHEKRPLVLDGSGRLYLRRYYEHERRVARVFSSLRRTPEGEFSTHEARNTLDRFFGENEENLQRKAAEESLAHRFCLITGGPGTGKTSTVVRILATLVEDAERGGRPFPEILLLAPTGKAAARLREATSQASERLEMSDAVRASLPKTASTIHRALGVRPDSTTRFNRTALSPLPYDVVLVDEASMIDLRLMRHLLEALAPKARLILLGDADQLASVEAGSVLSGLVDVVRRERAEDGASSLGWVELTQSFRFGPESGIYALAQAIRRGDIKGAERICGEGRNDLEVQSIGNDAKSEALGASVLKGFESVFQAKSADDALGCLSTYRLLAAHRTGPFGVSELNLRVRLMLAAKHRCPPDGDFYRGRPILITENDPATRLANGDVGVIWPNKDKGGRLMAYFDEGAGAARAVSLAELPAHETAFAMTIHKSQGSEYDEVAVLLPGEDSPLLGRELLYTAVTRAKKRVCIFTPEGSLSRAVRSGIRRDSGLADAVFAASRNF